MSKYYCDLPDNPYLRYFLSSFWQEALVPKEKSGTAVVDLPTAISTAATELGWGSMLPSGLSLNPKSCCTP